MLFLEQSFRTLLFLLLLGFLCVRTALGPIDKAHQRQPSADTNSTVLESDSGLGGSGLPTQVEAMASRDLVHVAWDDARASLWSMFCDPWTLSR